MRQHFTGYEADAETGLNFAQARYQSPAQGRFTNVDPLGASANVASPQSFNRYTYVLNNPTNLTDPSGMEPYRGADQSWSDVSAGFWGSFFDPNVSHFGGPAIIQNGMDGFPDRQEEEEAEEEGGEANEQGQQQQAPSETRVEGQNGNPADQQADIDLQNQLTDGNGIVRAVSVDSRAANSAGDTHFRLGDGKVYTIHIYGNGAGIYLPQGFGKPKYVGDNTVIATHKSGFVIGITHLDVSSQREVDRNVRSGNTNNASSRYLGGIGTGGGGSNYRHVHIHLYPNMKARTRIKEIKSLGKGMRDPTLKDSRYLVDVRRLLR